MKKADTSQDDQNVPLVRGKYSNLLERGTNLAILDADVVEHFPDSESVNDALRAYLAFRTAVVGAGKPPQAAKTKKTPYAFDPRTGRRTQKLAAAK